MAKEDDPWRRYKDREEEREREAQEEANRKAAKATPGQKRDLSAPDAVVEKFEEIIKKIPILLDQLEHLYRQYAVGTLERPPVEERLRLDQMMTTLSNFPKVTPGDRFRFNTTNSTYTTYKARWDKLLLNIEKGIIKRITGKNKGR